VSGLTLLPALGVVLGTGVVVLIAIDPRRGWLTWPERLGMSWNAGALALTLVMFCLSWAGARPTPGRVLPAIALLCGGLLFVRRRALADAVKDRGAGERPYPLRSSDLVALLLVVPVAVTLVRLFSTSLACGTYAWDAVSIWAYKAKVLSCETAAETGYFHDVTRSYSHLDYPLLVSLLQSWVFLCLGEMDDQLSRIIFPLFATAALAILYGSLSRAHGRRWALVGTAFVAAVPALSRVTSKANADVPLMAFAAGCVAAAYRYLSARERSHLLVAGVMAAGAMFTKNEGMAIFGVSLAVLAAAALSKAARWGDVAWYAALALALAGPWLVFRGGIPKTHEDFGGRLTPIGVAAALPRLPNLGRGFAQEFISTADSPPPSGTAATWRAVLTTAYFRLPWLLPAAALLAFWRKAIRPPCAWLALWVALHLLAYLAVYLVTPAADSEVAAFVHSTAGRIFLHVTPAATLVMVALAAPLRSAGAPPPAADS
jgi:hypothetical protein